MKLPLVSSEKVLKILAKHKFEKIVSTKSFIKGLSFKIQKNLEMLTKSRYSIIEEKNKLTLIKIKDKEYSNFEKKIIPLPVEIGTIPSSFLRK